MWALPDLPNPDMTRAPTKMHEQDAPDRIDPGRLVVRHCVTRRAQPSHPGVCLITASPSRAKQPASSERRKIELGQAREVVGPLRQPCHLYPIPKTHRGPACTTIPNRPRSSTPQSPSGNAPSPRIARNGKPGACCPGTKMRSLIRLHPSPSDCCSGFDRPPACIGSLATNPAVPTLCRSRQVSRCPSDGNSQPIPLP